MLSDSARQNIDFSVLSPRERAVVDGVVEGHTDEQIAQSLGISVATVNSYWARIRAKLGSLSRTEIATQYLRREMVERCAALEAQIATLRAREEALRAGESKPEAAGQAGDESWRFLALAHLPVAAMIVAKSGIVLYANPAARNLFGSARNELEGLPFWDLTLGADGSSCEQRIKDFFGNQEVKRIVSGLDQPYYARRRDGSAPRIIVSAEWFDSPDGTVAAVILREYSDDAVTHVRRLHELASLR